MIRNLMLPVLLTALVVPVLAAGQPSVDDVVSAVVRVDAEIPEKARTATALGTRRQGSGAVIDNNGLVLTVGYIILEAVKLTVQERGGKPVPAVFVGYDSDSGLGLLRALKPLKAKPIQLGTSAGLKREHPVLIVSHSAQETVKSAVVVSRRVFAGYWEYILEQAIFTAPPMQMFAGSALINSDLRLVGIGSLVVADATAGGVSFPGNMFIPIDELYPVLADLIATGRPARPAKPWLGVYVTEIYGRVVVTRTAAGSPARAKGLGEGDILLKVEGQEVLDMVDFFRKLWRLGSAGVTVNLSVLQQSEINGISLKSTDRYLHYSYPPMR